jgi:hypothetical protein
VTGITSRGDFRHRHNPLEPSYIPGDLHLYPDDGSSCFALKGERIGRFRSQKEGIRRFNELRSSFEEKLSSTEVRDEEKRNLLVREIGEPF